MIVTVDPAHSEIQDAHAALGGFVARCSLLEYRISQFMARWFCAGEKQKYLAYTFKAMPLSEKRQVIEERLTGWHDEPEKLRQTMAEISDLFERRNLAVNGVLSRRSSGEMCIKSFSGARYISAKGGIDILNITELEGLSEHASELADRMIALGQGLKAKPSG